jgi:2-phospho-L-lactate guanylyltransferase (CobY/MobA/RfbA family)
MGGAVKHQPPADLVVAAEHRNGTSVVYLEGGAVDLQFELC